MTDISAVRLAYALMINAVDGNDWVVRPDNGTTHRGDKQTLEAQHRTTAVPIVQDLALVGTSDDFLENVEAAALALLNYSGRDIPDPEFRAAKMVLLAIDELGDEDDEDGD